MSPWQDFCLQIAAHSARCDQDLHHAADTTPEGGMAMLAYCRLCSWHAVVILRPGDYPLSTDPAAAAATPQKES